jgi:hypothetical protein
MQKLGESMTCSLVATSPLTLNRVEGVIRRTDRMKTEGNRRIETRQEATKRVNGPSIFLFTDPD